MSFHKYPKPSRVDTPRLIAGASALLVLAIFICAGLAGCGLPSYPALYAPLLESAPTSPETGFEFEYGVTGDDVIDVFEGIELYYKIYASDEPVSEQIDADLLRIVDKATLESNGYRRFINASSSDSEDIKPLIPLTDDEKVDETLTLRLDFSVLVASEDPSEYPILYKERDDEDPVEIPLARNAAANATTYQTKNFAAESFSGSDGDVPDVYSSESDDTDSEVFRLYIALYALTYGNDYASLQFNIYSQPTYSEGYIAIPGL